LVREEKWEKKMGWGLDEDRKLGSPCRGPGEKNEGGGQLRFEKRGGGRRTIAVTKTTP